MKKRMVHAPSPTPGWSHFPHEADVGVRGYGADPAEAFANAARAMMAAIAPLDAIGDVQSVPITCDAPDLELLLVDWLNAVIYEMATRRMLFGDFQVAIEDTSLSAEAWGEPVDVARHAPAVEPKGATMSALRVAAGSDGRWVAQCVVDV
jgi:tRNA nucleotidyltransferase (CCA-adding enzyme)